MIDITKIISNKFDGSSHSQREILKLEGSIQYNDSVDIIQKVEGKIKQIYSHYCSSLSSAKTRKHPKDFKDYIGHWLWANADKLIKNTEVKNILIKEFSYPSEPKINKGESYYYQRNNNI
ncbi:MAG: hypothetical protein MJK08_03985 [Campylobacterales bacterium]|nr:hypothetical protein [Campylobacterales bacterium]